MRSHFATINPLKELQGEQVFDRLRVEWGFELLP